MTPVQAKIRKTSRGISIALNITQVAVIVGAVLSALGLAVILLNRPELVKLFVDVGEVADAQAAAIMMPALIAVLIAIMVVDAVSCHQLYRIFRDISREATPFAARHVRRLKTVAWLTLPMSILDGTLPNIQWALETGEAKMVICIELMWIFFGAIIYCLAFIFDYGCKLQQESDETL